jgi:hypothetical protein
VMPAMLAVPNHPRLKREGGRLSGSCGSCPRTGQTRRCRANRNAALVGWPDANDSLLHIEKNRPIESIASVCSGGANAPREKLS